MQTMTEPRFPLFSVGFRPFFLLAGLWSALALAAWVATLTTGRSLPALFPPLLWHIHEMLFGFVGAALAGFLLTAVPNWTGRTPVRGLPLVLLTLSWIGGRVAILMPTMLPAEAVMAIDVSFFTALVAVMACQIALSRNWKNLPMVAPVTLFGAADGLMYLGQMTPSVSPDLGWRLGLAAIVILISAIGGRVIPNFTRNWLTARAVEQAPAASGWIDRIAMATLHPALLGWAFSLPAAPLGILLLAAAAANLVRLARWKGLATRADPLLAILHLGYFWLVAGAALLGANLLTARIPEAAAVHAFTAGAIGTMTLAIMTRATLGHTGRPLRADRATTLIYLLVTAAALLRVAASLAPSLAQPLFAGSGTLWLAGFALFAARYGVMLCKPRLKTSG